MLFPIDQTDMVGRASLKQAKDQLTGNILCDIAMIQRMADSLDPKQSG